MAKPDFSKYSTTQLQQVLTRIDKERFSERVEEIRIRLAQLESEVLTRTEMAPSQPQDLPPEIAGFWPRAGAFVLDCLLLVLVGLLLGLFLHEQFEAMGSWGRAVGFLISLIYFGVMESCLFNGATLGNRALDIQVVTTAGETLGVGKALLRTAVFTGPYFLNGVNLGGSYTTLLLPSIQGLIVFGLGGAIAYLSIFNRRTRQSVHDLLVGTIVVRAGRTGIPSMSPVWKGHFATIAALFVLGIGAVAYDYAT